MFPRMTALSEVLWSPAAKRNWKDFERRLPSIYERLDKQKINYSKAFYDLKATVIPTDNYDGVLWKIESKNTNSKIKWTPSLLSSYVEDYSQPLLIKESTGRMAMLVSGDKQLSSVTQKFFFNKATGKKITLTTPADKKYPGNGAFTLVNGVQNEMGLNRSTEFLGFSGTDMEAVIDLGKTTDVSKVIVHILEQNGSWIYLPSQVKVIFIPDIDFTENDLKNFPSTTKRVDPVEDKAAKTISAENIQRCRYIKVTVKNFGIIPSGNAGAGNPAWLFVDEIEVQ